MSKEKYLAAVKYYYDKANKHSVSQAGDGRNEQERKNIETYVKSLEERIDFLKDFIKEELKS